jgi:hypothetical protein
MRMTFLKLLRSTLAIGAVAVAAGAGGLSAGAQLTGQNKPVGDENQAQTIKVTTRLIIENVGVKDKKGVPIGGLTAKDFTITEDGVAQKISYLRTPECCRRCHDPMPELTPAGAENIKIYNRLAHEPDCRRVAGQIKYKDHRLLALYFDMTAMPDRGGPDARAGGGAEVHPDADDSRRTWCRSCATREARWRCCRI